MNQEKKSLYINIAIIITSLIVIIGVFILLIYPLYEQIKTLNQEIQIKQQQEESLQNRLTQLKELETNYNKAKDKSQTINIALPNEKQIPEILVQLSNIAGESGMTLTEITPTKEQKEKSASSASSALYKELPLNIKLSGSFKGLKNYLSGIEKNLRIMDTNAISIEKDTQNPENKLLNISLLVVAYFQNKK